MIRHLSKQGDKKEVGPSFQAASRTLQAKSSTQSLTDQLITASQETDLKQRNSHSAAPKELKSMIQSCNTSAVKQSTITFPKMQVYQPSMSQNSCAHDLGEQVKEDPETVGKAQGQPDNVTIRELDATCDETKVLDGHHSGIVSKN